MTCPTDAELLGFADGSLAPEPRKVIGAHLDTCPSCLEIVAAVLRSSAPGGASEGRSTSSTPQSPLLADGAPRYVPGAEIARGGMGRILAAEDRLLGRPVALKRMRTAADDLEKRFLREQRITARLQHPAIVPIYDAGVLEGGDPFFVMRLVKGESLDRAVAKATSMDERLRLLAAVIGVVDAVAYAHGERVVHRDLKPQNILIGPFGEVVVLDWGLARELERTDPNDGTGALTRSDDPGDASDDPAATRAGEVLGTPGYMAPEQSDGRAADTRSDVYGLGAVLYHVLTGGAPHAERSTTTADPSNREAALPIRDRAPAAPLDLLAIVDRAMATDPDARYASARELAEDLKRWQAGRLVEAHRYSPGDLVRRFIRRYRAPLLVAMAALVVLVTLGGLSLERIFAERARALSEQARAEGALHRAEEQRVAAETLVSFILGDLRSRLERVGRLDALAGVAKAVMGYQDRAPAAEDVATLLRRSEVAGLAGDVAFANGDLDAADASYARSAAAADAANQKQVSPEARCRAALRLGDVRKRRGELDAATEHYQRCIELARDVGGPASKELSVRGWLALGEMAKIRGELPAARKILEDARPVAVSLAAEAGGPAADASHLLFTLHSDLAQTLFIAGEVAAARDEAGLAVELARARRDARADDANARYDHARALALLGLAEQTGGDLVTPEARYREALAEHRLLAARDPSNADWQRAVGVDADRMGSLMNLRGDRRAAIPWLKESAEVSVRVSEIAPENLEWKRDIFISRLALGAVLVELGELDEARKELTQALKIQEELMAAAPGAGRSARELGMVLLSLGEVEFKAGRPEAGRAALERSIAVEKEYLRSVDTAPVRQDLAGSLLLLAKNEEGAAALGHIEEAVAILAPVRNMAAANPGLDTLIKQADEALAKAKRK
jgi:tetratricopeptide (TPR) repeat protein